jgi:hypothetical protein
VLYPAELRALRDWVELAHGCAVLQQSHNTGRARLARFGYDLGVTTPFPHLKAGAACRKVEPVFCENAATIQRVREKCRFREAAFRSRPRKTLPSYLSLPRLSAAMVINVYSDKLRDTS